MKYLFDFLEGCVAMVLAVLICPFGWVGLTLLAVVIWIIKQ